MIRVYLHICAWECICKKKNNFCGTFSICIYFCMWTACVFMYTCFIYSTASALNCMSLILRCTACVLVVCLYKFLCYFFSSSFSDSLLFCFCYEYIHQPWKLFSIGAFIYVFLFPLLLGTVLFHINIVVFWRNPPLYARKKKMLIVIFIIIFIRIM